MTEGVQTEEQARGNEVLTDTEIVGLGAIIIHATTGKILAIRERSGKAATGRERGQLSIPLETRKIGEDWRGNLAGAMAEAFDDVDVSGRDIRVTLAQSLKHMDGNTIHEGFTTRQNGRRIRCNYAVMIYDGPDLRIQPFNALEVGDPQWVTLSEFSKNGVRPLAQMVIADAIQTGAYEMNRFGYHRYPTQRRQLFDQSFSIRETFKKREMLSDTH